MISCVNFNKHVIYSAFMLCTKLYYSSSHTTILVLKVLTPNRSIVNASFQVIEVYQLVNLCNTFNTSE